MAEEKHEDRSGTETRAKLGVMDSTEKQVSVILLVIALGAAVWLTLL